LPRRRREEGGRGAVRTARSSAGAAAGTASRTAGGPADGTADGTTGETAGAGRGTLPFDRGDRASGPSLQAPGRPDPGDGLGPHRGWRIRVPVAARGLLRRGRHL